MGYLGLIRTSLGVKCIYIYVCHSDCYAYHWVYLLGYYWGNSQDLRNTSSELGSIITFLGSNYLGMGA
ncbi:hypothetical protein MKX01_001310 [Papaver californicum]|nr:hypothetical protein MKX01_001310 [Papaver californicum]